MKRLLFLSASLIFLVGCSTETESQNSTPVENEEVTEDLKDDEIESEAVIEKAEEPEEDASEDQGDLQEDTEEGKTMWGKTINEIAASDATETEKTDQIMIQAAVHETTQEEVDVFLEDIIDEFDEGFYLNDLNNHEYMLTNIFKAHVVENYYDDAEQLPEDQFAYDFLQNSNYAFRGVDAVDSESVISNEEQMEEALLEIRY